jgi:fused signal recognition particle receptor
MHSVLLAEIGQAGSTLLPAASAIDAAQTHGAGWYAVLVAGLLVVAVVIWLVVFKLLGPGKPAAGETDEAGEADAARAPRPGAPRGPTEKSAPPEKGRPAAGKKGVQEGRAAVTKGHKGEAEIAKAGGRAPGSRRGEERPPGVADRPESIAPTAPAPHQRELREGLEKTRAGFIARIGALLRRKEIDQDLFAQLEEVLLTADIGVKTAQRLFEQVRSSLSRKELSDPQAVWAVIKEESQKLLTVDAPPLGWASHKPFVILIIGVNGAGKTTTIGKLAAQQVAAGRKVVLAAGDTFRAAAVEQLEIWGQRAKVPVVRGKEGGDPSAVIFDAIKLAQKDQADVVIADTAGRLHVKEQLMAELQKVRRVMKKADPTAPHETWLVLDATNGQNALAQASTFKEMMEITGIVLTKLDGTAKGGVILGIAHELGVPVRYIGVGEKISDLRAFDAADFVDVLYDQAVT